MNIFDLLVSFTINLVAILLFTYTLYYRRHKRRDLFVTYTFFNICLFIIVNLITSTEIGLGVSFGLFALLAIIRLRSEEFSNYEIGYFFGCLTLAIVNGLLPHAHGLAIGISASILISIGLLDRKGSLRDTHNSKVVLDNVYSSDGQIKAVLENNLNATVLGFTVLEIDYVKDMTHLNVQYKRKDY